MCIRYVGGQVLWRVTFVCARKTLGVVGLDEFLVGANVLQKTSFILCTEDCFSVNAVLQSLCYSLFRSTELSGCW